MGEREAFLENRHYLPGESSPFEPVQAPWMLRLLGAKPIYHVTRWILLSRSCSSGITPRLTEIDPTIGAKLPREI